jgi:environmental stress-induced protein Ves
MPLRVILLQDARPQPWANGGGATRELLARPSTAGLPWRLRVSVATIDRDGPFSSLPGVRRWFAVLSGSGVVLKWPALERRLAPGDDPIEFDGADAPGCRLDGGTTLDLNLMVRGGGGSMRAASAGVAQPLCGAQGGLYAAAAGKVSTASEVLEVVPHTLVWSDALGREEVWRFDPVPGAVAPIGFWLEVGAAAE